MKALDRARSSGLQPIGSTIQLVAATLVLNALVGCATAPSVAVQGCGSERVPGARGSEGPAAVQVLSRSAGRALGMGGSEAGRAARVTGNRYVDTLLSGAVRDSVTAARRVLADAADQPAADQAPDVRYMILPRVGTGRSRAIQVSSPLINDAPWQLEVPRQGAVVATHAPAEGSSHVVTTNVEVGARRTDVSAVVVASCRYLEGLGNRATQSDGPS
jgi:hypothetical protein